MTGRKKTFQLIDTMGYTNFFQFHTADSHDERFIAAVQLFKEIETDNGHIKSVLAGGQEEDDPVISENEIWFNGKPGYGMETFHLRRNDIGFHFCKTNKLDYDYDVVLCCVCFKYIFQEDFGFDCDGKLADNPNVYKAITEINRYIAKIGGSCKELVMIEDILTDAHFDISRVTDMFK